MTEKLYGAKCIRCGCIEHHGSEGLDAEPLPWLETQGMECARCIRCQERALSRAIEAAGLFIFAPEVRAATDAFMHGRPHPIIDRLRTECLALNATIEFAGASWSIVDALYADDEHLTLTVRALGGVPAAAPERGETP